MVDERLDQELPDDEVEINLRPVAEVGRRLLILAALVEHLTAADGEAPGAEDHASNTFDLREWMRAEEIWPDLTQDEVLLLSSGTSPGAEIDQFSVQETIEALGAIAWSLHLVPSLEPDTPASPDGVIPVLPHPWESVSPWLRGLELRSLDEIATRREAAELWTWRLLTEEDLREALPHERDELLEIISETEREGRAAGVLARGGFRIQGRDVSILNLTERNALLSSTLARLKTFNWVCGYGARWDDVPLDI